MQHFHHDHTSGGPARDDAHPHAHGDGADHTHPHAHDIAGTGADRTQVLLDYAYGHNVRHTGELKELEDALRDAGRNEAADFVAEAVARYEEGNSLLHSALHTMTEEDG